jgi:hypothetical protein
VAQGVVEQVAQHALESVGIDLQLRAGQPSVDSRGQDDAATGGRRLVRGDDFADERSGVDRQPAHLERAHLDLAQLEQVVYQAAQVLDLAADEAQVALHVSLVRYHIVG